MKEFKTLIIIILIATFLFICLALATGLGTEAAGLISATGCAIAIGTARHWPFRTAKVEREEEIK